MNLLFPFEKDNVWVIPDDTYQHLAIDELVDNIGVTKDEKEVVRKVFKSMPLSEDTITYRREILMDLISNVEFSSELGEILNEIDVLNEYKKHNSFFIEKRSSIWSLIDYMNEMDIYIRVIEELNILFGKYEMNSRGLKEMSELLSNVINTDKISELKEVVDKLKTDMSGVQSVLVGINLSPDLYPEEIRVLEYYTYPIPSKYEKTSLGMSLASRKKVTYRIQTPFMKHACDDMEKHLSKSVSTYKAELRNYINLKGYFLLDIISDLRYYLLMAKYAKKLTSDGYNICYPNVSNEFNHVSITGLYNIRLAGKKLEPEKIVKNDFSFSDKERLFILTGPNRGGKTMLTQAVGINAFLAGEGLFVAGDSYEGFLFDKILTHFPADENQTLDLGRLGEEAVRVKSIVKEATSHSLVLLNETYSSTSSQDGLYLAKDLVHVLKDKNVPLIFNTHIHELARSTNEMNMWEGDSKVVSITMEMINNENTFKVLKKEPDSSSFAHNIALKYEVTYEQMKKNE